MSDERPRPSGVHKVLRVHDGPTSGTPKEELATGRQSGAAHGKHAERASRADEAESHAFGQASGREPEPPMEPGYPHHPELPPTAATPLRAAAEPHYGHGHSAHTHSGALPSEDGRDAHAGHGGRGGGHDKHAGHSVAMFRDKFWISLALTVPTLIWGHMLQMALGYTAPRFAGAQWIPPVFGIAVFLYGGRVFLQGAVGELKARLPGMMTLIALAITVAFVFSVAVLLGFPGMPLWEEVATLVTIMLLGHWVEMRSISQAQGAVSELAKLLPSTAVRLRGEVTEEVPVSELREGDLVPSTWNGRFPAPPASCGRPAPRSRGFARAGCGRAPGPPAPSPRCPGCGPRRRWGC